MSTFSRAARLTLLLPVVVSLAACGGGDDEAKPTATESTSATATAATSTGTPPASETPSATPTATQPASPATPRTPAPPPPPPPTVPPDDTPFVACGDIRAPLDKAHRLPADCVPPDLVTLPGEYVSSAGQRMRSAAAEAFRELFAAAQNDGYTILAASAYRSYQEQVTTYLSHVSRGGQAYADRISARPGHSEHQLGTTTDVTSASAGYGLESFEGTPEAAWLAANSWKYGFIISYPAGKESITGYVYEPWHIRWVGKAEAERVKNSGLTLHEWLLR